MLQYVHMFFLKFQYDSFSSKNNKPRISTFIQTTNVNGAKYSHIPYFLFSNTQKEKNLTLIKVEISFHNNKTRFSVIFFGYQNNDIIQYVHTKLALIKILKLQNVNQSNIYSVNNIKIWFNQQKALCRSQPRRSKIQRTNTRFNRHVRSPTLSNTCFDIVVIQIALKICISSITTNLKLVNAN